MRPTQETRETAFLTYIWGVIFAAGLFIAYLGIIALSEWNLVGIIVFPGIASLLLISSLLIFQRIKQRQFAALSEETE